MKMEWHLTMSYFITPILEDFSVYERMSVVILGAMLWGFFEGCPLMTSL